MTTRHLLHDAGHCLRAATPPLLALSVLALARPTRGEVLTPAGVGELLLLAWRAAMIGTLLWLLVAVIWAATRPLRDRRAFQRLQNLREIAADPDRVLVHVQTVVWSSAAGQQVVVVTVATGVTSRVWLPEVTVPIGSYVVVEREGSGARVVDWLSVTRVEAGHRYERRLPAGLDFSHPRASVANGDDRDDARQLIEEAEQFLREQGSR